MERAAQLLAEVQVLGTLCGQECDGEQRTELARILEGYNFLEPEHQVVFESIRFLLPHDRISAARLAVHLNNRGFPSVELDRYFAAALPDMEEALGLARQLCSLGRVSRADVH
jgi:hypothetical protein